MTNNQVLIILVALFIKHFFADYVMQGWFGGYIVMGKGRAQNWIGPNGLHALEHAVFTSLIFMVAVSPSHFWLGLVDFAIHFVVDRAKSTTTFVPKGQWAPEDKAKNLNKFYLAFGADQTVHSLTYLFLMALALHF